MTEKGTLQMFKEYGKLSTRLYEHTKPVGYSINGDIEYYAKKLKNLSGRVLEAGVGTGRILIPLVKKSITIDGVDISDDMLGQCKVNMEKHDIAANIYKQDLTKLSLPHKYGAIIMPTGSFCLLPKVQVQEILIGFYNQLDDGGKLIVDLEMPTDFREGESTTSHFPLSADTGILLTVFNETIDWFAQKVSSVYRYELIERGAVTQTEISHFVLYWYGITEFEMLLARSGFKRFEHEIGYGNSQSQIVTFTAFKNK
ncbi:class I SAM-dependent methyltransferase [Desulfovibrio sp.]|uniref:class I SAM-dependent DNA methyltransferase n=1 Tax=Desulfovibrio sp. TaxID=885 RepID=UPI0025C71390|nr:class I SAM-dependent methyltransferase [Desulfovibrio sp.]